MIDEVKTGAAAESTDTAAKVAPSSQSPITNRQSPIHQIRLGPPWSVTPTAGGTGHARKFGRPRTLDAGERLWLVCEHIPGAAEVRVNGAAVGTLESPGPFAADITELMQQRNEVVFAVAAGEPLGAVALEVRPV